MEGKDMQHPVQQGHVEQQLAQHQQAASAFSAFMQLPDTAKATMVAHLDRNTRQQLRLGCKALLELADACATKACYEAMAPCHTAPPMLQPQRFPRLLHLGFHVFSYDADEQPAFTQAALQLSLAAHMSADLWPTVTTLRLFGLNEADTACFLSRCPNVNELMLWSVAMPGDNEPQRLPGLIRHVCSSLPSLSGYEGSGWIKMGAEELCTFASCKHLTALDVSLAPDVGLAAWFTLASIKQLRSLSIHIGGAIGWPEGAQWDLRDLVLLTQLTVSYHPDDREPGLYGGMHLPSSLIELTLNRMPVPVLPVLCQLTKLRFGEELIDSDVVTRLAASCPALISLSAPFLDLSQAYHAVPLRALTHLRVFTSCTVAAGSCLARSFPALCTLRLHCECEFEAGPAFFEGATALQTLDVCRFRGYDEQYADEGLSMQVAHFAVLAALPQLTALRVNAEPAHVQGLCMLSHLQRLGLVFAAGPDNLSTIEGLHEALDTFGPPAHMGRAYLEFVYADSGMEDADEEFGLAAACCRTADAAASWLALAPALLHTTWNARWMGMQNPFMSMTNVRLACIATNPSIQRIEADSGSSAVTAVMLEHVLNMHKGLAVDIEKPLEYEAWPHVGHPLFE